MQSSSGIAGNLPSGISGNLQRNTHTNTIAQLEAKIADPYVSEFEKQKLRDFRDFQQRNLENARRELAAAEEKLTDLEVVIQ